MRGPSCRRGRGRTPRRYCPQFTLPSCSVFTVPGMTVSDSQAPRSDVPAVLARGLTKRYGDLTAVNDVDLEVGVGDVYGLLGPNGAGKTTFMRMIFGLIRPDA